MLDLSRTRISESYETPYTGPKPVSGAALSQGVAVESLSQPISGSSVVLSTGTAKDVFRGVSMTPIAAESYVAEVIKAEINDDKKIVLPLTGYTESTARITKADGTVVSLDALTVENNATVLDLATDGVAGVEVTVSISRELSAAEALANSGPSDQIVAKQPIAQLTRITDGEIYTNAFDTSVEWKIGDTIKTGANGVFTNTGDGVVVSKIVLSVPSASDPFLGFELSAVSS